MRILKYAILGLLYRQECSGYDITSQFKQEIGQFWSAKHSQIYPELKKLVDENLVQFRTVIQGEKLEKKMYTITEAGKQELLQWAGTTDPLPETEKDTFMLKMYFIHTLPIEEARALFENQLRLRWEKLDDLKLRYEELERTFGMEKQGMTFANPNLGHYLVLTKALAREKSYVEWLEHHLKIFM